MPNESPSDIYRAVRMPLVKWIVDAYAEVDPYFVALQCDPGEDDEPTYADYFAAYGAHATRFVDGLFEVWEDSRTKIETIVEAVSASFPPAELLKGVVDENAVTAIAYAIQQKLNSAT